MPTTQWKDTGCVFAVDCRTPLVHHSLQASSPNPGKGQGYRNQDKGDITVPAEDKIKRADIPAEEIAKKVKFVVYGEEMIEKEVKLSGSSCRVYLPSGWVGCQVKIIRIN